MGTTPDWLGLFTGTIGANGRTHGEIRPGISIREYYEDLCLCISIVEELNLNTRIWSKE